MLYEQIVEAANYIKEKINVVPEIGMILGSGLGQLADSIPNPIIIPYHEIPNFVSSTAPGHKGQFVIGNYAGKNVICMQGRLHLYEGHDIQSVVLPVRVMKLLGVETLFVTNASGSVNTSFEVGDFMLIDDHINYLGANPTIGKNMSEFGSRFFDMTYTYTPSLKELVVECAKKLSIEIKRGVYLATTGPSFETPAEIRMFRSWGADACGMSTVPEVITAAHCGMKVIGISLITNMCAGILDQELTEEEVIEIGKNRSKELERLTKEIIASI